MINNRKPLRKIFLILFFTSISGLAILYHNIYPLYITLNGGFLSQIPLIFWPVITVSIFSGLSYCILTSSTAGISASISIVFIIINFKQYLFFNFTGGDSAGEISRWYSIQNLPRFSPELFSYFQWPLHFTFFEIYNKILGLPLMDMVRLSYISLYFLFIVAVLYFFSKYTSGNSYWMASSVYVIYMMMFLNNQFVPQLFGLVILIFLLGFGTDNTPKSSFIQLFLYFVLVWSHPFFFVFYLASVAIFPFVRSIRIQLSKHGAPHAPVYSSLWKTLFRPSLTIKGVVYNASKDLKSNFLPKLALMTAIYVVSLQFRFPNFKQRFYNEFTGSLSPHSSGSLLSRVPEIISSGASGVPNEQETTLLYELSSEFLHTVSIYIILGILASLLLLSLAQFFRTRTENISVVPISAGISGGIYYIGGFIFPIIGPRAYQIAFLPVGVFIAGRNLDSRVVKAVILIALVASPVIGANAMINASIAGGGNTQNHQAHAAGQHLAQFDVENGEATLKYPHSGLPPEFTLQQNQRIISLEELLLQEETIQDQFRNPSLIVFGPRQIHIAAHYRNECNFEPSNRNVVYDNNVTILSDSTSMSGINCVGIN